jgi:hypothetical protein
MGTEDLGILSNLGKLALLGPLSPQASLGKGSQGTIVTAKASGACRSVAPPNNEMNLTKPAQAKELRRLSQC